MGKWINGIKTEDTNSNKIRNKIKSLFFDILEKNAYDEIDLPVLDYADTYIINNQFSSAQNHFKSIAPNGEVMSLPNDIVVGLISYSQKDLLKEGKMCASSQKFTFLPNECEKVNDYCIAAINYGKSGEEVESDVILVAYNFAKKLGIKEPKIIISNTDIFQGILNTFAQQKENRERLLKIISGKIENDIDYATSQLLNTIKNVEGPGTIIQELAQKTDNQESIDGLLNLFEIYTIFEAYNIDAKIIVKPAYLGRHFYDKGVVFEITDENRKPIIYGGRCDCNKGKETIKCVYMEVDINNAIEIGINNNVLNCDVRTVIIAVAESRVAMHTAIKLKEDCIAEGLIVDVKYKIKEQDVITLIKQNQGKAVLYVDEKGDIKHN